MAHIEDLIRARFQALRDGADPEVVIGELDLLIMHVGKMVEKIWEGAVFPTDGNVDSEGLAALSISLLALLGQAGDLIDVLEKQRAQAARHNPSLVR